jgi:formylglycine-generating enzyme required for sulfatase activity
MESAEAVIPEVGEYRLVRSLDGRAESSTFLAHDRALDRAVVLRFLPPEAAARRRLLAAARALARVAHPAVCAVHRVNAEGRRPFVVLEYAEGVPLGALGAPLGTLSIVAMGRALGGALAALHAAGLAHGAVRASHIVASVDGEPRLMGLGAARAGADAEARAADVIALVTVLAELAEPDLRAQLAPLANAKAPSAEGLLAALDALDGRASRGVELVELAESPYLGLEPFGVAHAGRFFGRQAPLARALAWLRSQPWVVVAGPAGSGKSSFARAGIAAAIARGNLGERARWDVAVVEPGSRPLAALAAALAQHLSCEADPLVALLRAKPAFAARLLRARPDVGLVVLIDPLDDLFATVDAAEREAFLASLESFGAMAPGLRVVMTLQSALLERIGELTGAGRDLMAATQMLPAMRDAELREAIVGPARARGFEFETPAMVDALAREASSAPEELPLLEFALAELWEARDTGRRVLPEAALGRMGGAAQALARHGEVVLASLGAEARREARRLLVQLARGPASREALLDSGATGRAARDALGALARGRLVVVGETCKLAHVRLAEVWQRLRGWVLEASAERAQAARLRAAALEWRRLGRGAEGLLGAKRLAEVSDAAGLPIGDDERAFVAASRAAVRRTGRRSVALAVGLLLLAVTVGVGAWGVAARRHRAAVDAVVAEALALQDRAEVIARDAADIRAKALELFDADDPGPAEELWKQTLAREADADRARQEVGAALERALAIEPRHAAARARYADLVLTRLLAAERLHEPTLVTALRGHLGLYDDGSRAGWLMAPGHVTFDTDPPGGTVTLSRYRDPGDGHLVEADATTVAAGQPRALEMGSYLAVATLRGRYATRYPFTVERGEQRAIRISLPRVEDVPESMIYVPAGRFLYGSGDDEATRRLLTHQPMRPVELPAFLVARQETTWGEYLTFLRALPATEREARRSPLVRLDEAGRATLSWRGKTLAEGDPYCLPPEPCADWRKLPVASVSRDDVEAYAVWLATSGRLPGARLCADREWERMARGADDRRFVWGEARPRGDDACSVDTFGGEASRAGWCSPGAHPSARSPFGADDAAGNVWEWTAGTPDKAQPGLAAVRGAGWTEFGFLLAVANRELTSVASRTRAYGVRLCATPR